MNRPLNPSPEQLSAFASLQRHNPHLNGMTPVVGSEAKMCSIDRVMFAGGQLGSYVTPTSITPFEALYRRLPQSGVFTATPAEPVIFDMGSFRVPEGMSLVMLDYRFDIYRPSGTTAGDFVPLEDKRLSTNVGWDISSDGVRQGNTHYEISPIPPQENSPAFRSNPNPGFIPGGPGSPASDAQFEQARFTQAQSSSGDGLSIMPQRHHREGLLHVPASWVLKSGSNITLTCRVIRGIPIPIAFFEAEIFGFLLPTLHMEAIQKATASCILPPGGY